MSQEIEEPSRGLLRSMFIIGSAKSINILILMLRMKAVALLLGPAGVGVLALYSNFKEVVTQIASMGIATSGVREEVGRGHQGSEGYAPLSIVTDLKLRSSGLMPAAPSFASSCSLTGCFCAILLQLGWNARGGCREHSEAV